MLNLYVALYVQLSLQLNKTLNVAVKHLIHSLRSYASSDLPEKEFLYVNKLWFHGKGIMFLHHVLPSHENHSSTPNFLTLTDCVFNFLSPE